MASTEAVHLAEGSGRVGRAYDAWTREGVLERYWGEHIHHGYYPQGRPDGDFRQAKVEMIDRLLRWSHVMRADRVLDLGCGIGGSSRHLSSALGAEVVGVTVSAAQAARAWELTPPGLANRIRFRVADAVALPFLDESFELVWACESAEHMPDKEAALREMVRVLRPGGTLLVATWCRRPVPPALSDSDRALLDRIYRAWALPPFVTLERWLELARGMPPLVAPRSEDWTDVASPTWRHQVREGISTLPWLLRRPAAVLRRTLRDGLAVHAMIRGYDRGLIRYGVLAAKKGGLR